MGLLGLLAGLRPHMDPRVKFDLSNRGIGTLRLAAADGVLVGTVVDKRMTRSIAAATLLLSAEGDCEDVWIGANAVSAIVGMLEVSEARECVVDVAKQWIEVREEGVVWGGRKIRVPRMSAPWSEDTVDPTQSISQALVAPMLMMQEEILQADDCRLFSKTCKALGAPLMVREVLTGNALTYVWGGTGADEESAWFVGVSNGPITADAVTTGELPTSGDWLEVLAQVPVVADEEPETYVGRGISSIEAYANSEDVDEDDELDDEREYEDGGDGE